MNKNINLQAKRLIVLFVVVTMVMVSFAILFDGTATSVHSGARSSAFDNSTPSAPNQLPYVSSTIDLASHQTYSGNYAGNNFLGITGMAYDPNNGNIYVAAIEQGSVHGDRQYDNFNGSLVVLNASTMDIIGRISVGITPTFVLYDSGNNLLYVSNLENSTVSVINPSNNSLYATIAIPDHSGPMGMTYDPANGTVYLITTSNITIIRGTRITGWINAYGESSGAISVAYDSSNHYLYTALIGQNFSSVNNATYKTLGVVRIINTKTDSIIGDVNVGSLADWLSYGNGYIYASALASKNLTVIQGSSIVKNITLPAYSIVNYYNAGTGDVYVSSLSNSSVNMVLGKVYGYVNNGTSSPSNVLSFMYNSTISAAIAGSVYVVNPTDGDIAHTVSESVIPEFMSTGPANSEYIANVVTGTIQQVTSTFSVTSTHLTNTPTSVVYDSSNNYIYVTNTLVGQVQVYNANNGVYVATITTGGFPVDMAVDTGNGKVYVTNALNESIEIISGTSLTGFISTGHASVLVNSALQETGFGIGHIPLAIVYDPHNSEIYVADYTYGAISSQSSLNAQISIINTANNKFVANLSSPELASLNQTLLNYTFAPLGMVFDPSNDLVYVDGLLSPISGSDSVEFVAYELDSTSVVGSIVTPFAVTAQDSPDMEPVYDPVTHDLLMPLEFGYMVVNSGRAHYMSLFHSSTSGLNVYTMPAGMAYDQSTGDIIMSDFFTIHDVISGSISTVYDTGVVSVLNATTLSFVGNVTVGEGSDGVSVTASGLIYVANTAFGTVSVLSPYSTSTGTLKINLKTLGASVTLNGESIQLTDNTYTAVLNPGYYYVNASLGGYTPYSNYFRVTSSSVTTLNIELKKISNYGYLEGYSSPSDVSLTANNITIPVASGYFNSSLPTGKYYVSAFAPGYSPREFQVTINTGVTTSLHIVLNASKTTVAISGHVSPFNASLPYSVLVNGTSTLVNDTGYFVLYLPAGIYTVSVYEKGYFPTSTVVDATSSTNIYFALTPEPKVNSTAVSGSVTATGYNTSVSNVTIQNGALTVNFTAKVNGTLVFQVPYSTLKNITISNLLNSKVYINGKEYKNFTVTLTSNYTVFVTVKGLSGDPTMYWVYSPSYSIPVTHSTSSLSPYLMYVIYGVIAVIVVVGAVFTATRLRKR